MSEHIVIPFPNCRLSRGSEAQSGDFLPVELAGDRGRTSASESVSPAPFSAEGLDRLLLQATRTAARSRQFAKRARQFLSECQSVSCGGASPKIPQ